MATTTAPITRRERARAATIDEIKQTALTLMREQHTADVRFTDIAKVMGITPPALYRYFDDRDNLITELITDAYDELGDWVATAIRDIGVDDVWLRWVAAGQAYRHWALQEPERFALILGMPIAGYVADETGPTTEAAKRAMSQLAGLFIEARQLGQLRRPLIQHVSAEVAACARDDHGKAPGQPQLEPESFQAMLNAWAGLHGFTTLEAYGHLDWMGAEARDSLFEAQLHLIAQTAGLPTH